MEKIGQDEFDFEFGANFAKHIEAVQPTFCKVLVRYNREGDSIQRAKALRKRVGVVINPATPAAVLRRVREMIERDRAGCELEVHGGIDATTAPLGVAAGANVGMNRLRPAIQQAAH